MLSLKLGSLPRLPGKLCILTGLQEIAVLGAEKMITEITNPIEKKAIARNVLEALTDWFGIEESREEYISRSAGWTFLAAREDNNIMGFLCLKETGKATVELAVMGS